VLYDDEKVIYIGRASRLITRLHSHANKVTSKHYFSKWKSFSAFVLKEANDISAEKLAFVESILIAASPGTRNAATPKLKKLVIPKPLRNAARKSS
ncbi:MAG TPA: hypothetical protein VL346_07735, partial [Acidobacteriaceae bacterium]|nr:hypothetical protein [Acidobacteriaceae bacterium]